jgi:predicted DNA-binding transcriptional regulator AlpA
MVAGSIPPAYRHYPRIPTRRSHRATRQVSGQFPPNPIKAAFSLNFPSALRHVPIEASPRHLVTLGIAVNSTMLVSQKPLDSAPPVTLSRWVNEALPPIQELLSAQDVARLTRRPKLVITGLMLLRRFPNRRRYRGRQVGWLRGDILDWMARDLTSEVLSATTIRCSRRHPRQVCLPFEGHEACSAVRVSPGNAESLR